MTRALESLAVATNGVVASDPGSDGLHDLRVLEVMDLPRWKRAVDQARSTGYGNYFPYVMAHQRPGRRTVLIGEDTGSLCVFLRRDRRRGSHLDLFLPPIPMDGAVLRRCLERANDFNRDRSARIQRIDANDAERVASLPGMRVRRRREQYLYEPRAFGDLGGQKYKTLRYRVSRARRMPTLEVVPYRQFYADGCRSLLKKWSDHHRATFGTSGDAGLSRRALALIDVLPAPDLVGELLLLGGRVVGFAFGGELRSGLACLFEAKTDPEVPGLTHFQCWSFLSKLDAFERVNGGSDARRGGIGQLKDSLRPVAMHREYRATQV